MDAAVWTERRKQLLQTLEPFHRQLSASQEEIARYGRLHRLIQGSAVLGVIVLTTGSASFAVHYAFVNLDWPVFLGASTLGGLALGMYRAFVPAVTDSRSARKEAVEDARTIRAEIAYENEKFCAQIDRLRSPSRVRREADQAVDSEIGS